MWLKEELKKFVLRGEFVLSSGKRSDYYFDLKEAFGNPELLTYSADKLYSLVDKKPDFVASTGLGGTILATAISLRQGINLTLIRGEKKTYGTCNILEGYTPKEGEAGIIVDDVFTTGSSILRAMNEVLKCGAHVYGGYVVVRRSPAEIGIPVKHLFTLEDLL